MGATSFILLAPRLPAGNSVCVFVHGFEPYFYVEAPCASFSPDDCAPLAETLNVSMQCSVCGKKSA